MAFNENTFIVAGTAIAIFGVALYIWDSRKDTMTSSYNSMRQMAITGGTSKRQKSKNRKTRKMR